MITVGKNTRTILEKLTLEEIQSMVPEEWVMRILEVGGVTTDFRSVWLLVFWGRLTRGGMILTPMTYDLLISHNWGNRYVHLISSCVFHDIQIPVITLNRIVLDGNAIDASAVFRIFPVFRESAFRIVGDVAAQDCHRSIR